MIRFEIGQIMFGLFIRDLFKRLHERFHKRLHERLYERSNKRLHKRLNERLTLRDFEIHPFYEVKMGVFQSL